jgi:hypothetical protein
MRNVLAFCAAFAVVMTLAMTAEASIQATDTILISDGPGNTNGGEFQLFYKLNGGGSWIQTHNTFCVEKSEFIGTGTTYDVHSVIPEAVLGGLGGQDTTVGGLTADTLSKETAWLFNEFVEGTLLGYNYGAGRAASADILQEAIWIAEDEVADTGTNTYYNLVTVASVNKPSDADMNAALTMIRVINPIVKGTDGTVEADHRQSLLHRIIPEPTTALVWAGLCLIGIGASGRRSKRS